MAENREIGRGSAAQENQRFAQLFGDSDGHFTFTGANVREAIERLRIDGQSYAERYEIGEITDNNYQAAVHHVMDNITNGDIAKSYWNSEPDQVMQVLLLGKNPGDPLVTSLQPPSPIGVGRPESLSLWKQVMGIFGFYKEERKAYQRQMEDYQKAQTSLRIYNENAFQAAQEARAVESRIREVCAVEPARKEKVREAFATQEKRTALQEAARSVEGLRIPTAEAAAERIRRYIPDYRPEMRSALGLPGFNDPNTVLDMLQAYESAEMTAEQLQGAAEEQRREIGQRFAQVFKLTEAPAAEAQAGDQAAQPAVTDAEKDAAAAAVARIYTRFSEGKVPQLDVADPESIRANGTRIVRMSRTASTLYNLMGGGENPDPEFAAMVARRLPENADIVQSLAQLQAVYGYCQQAWSAMRVFDQDSFVGQPDGGSLNVTAENRDLLKQGGNFMLFGDRLHVFGDMQINELPDRAAELVGQVLNAAGDSPADMAALFNGRPVETMGAVSPEFIAATAARLPRNVLNGQYQQQLARQAAAEQERTEAVRRQQEEEIQREQNPQQQGPQAEDGQPQVQNNGPQDPQQRGQNGPRQAENNGPQQNAQQQVQGQNNGPQQNAQQQVQGQNNGLQQNAQARNVQTQNVQPQVPQQNAQQPAPQQQTVVRQAPQPQNAPQTEQNQPGQDDADPRLQTPEGRQAIYDELGLGDMQRSVLEEQEPAVRAAYLERRRENLERMEREGRMEAYQRVRTTAPVQPEPARTEETIQEETHQEEIERVIGSRLTPEQAARWNRLREVELAPELYAELLTAPQQEWETRLPRILTQYQSFGEERITPENDLSKIRGEEAYLQALVERSRAYNEQTQTELYDQVGLSSAERDIARNLDTNERDRYQRILRRIQDSLMALGAELDEPDTYLDTYRSLRKIEIGDVTEGDELLEDILGENSGLEEASAEERGGPVNDSAEENNGPENTSDKEDDGLEKIWDDHIKEIKSEVHKVLDLPEDLQEELNKLSEDEWIRRIAKLERQAALGQPITRENDLSVLEGRDFEEALAQQRRTLIYDELGMNEQERAAMEYLDEDHRKMAIAAARQARAQAEQQAAQQNSQTPEPEPPAQPTAEQPAQPTTDQPAQPTAEQPAQPAADRQAQPAAEQPAQPAADQLAQPAAEQPVQPAADQLAQPATEQPAQPAAEQPAQPTAAQPTTGQPGQPIAGQPAPQPTAQPTPQPAPQPIQPQPAPQPAPQPTQQQRAPQPAPQPVQPQPAPQPVQQQPAPQPPQQPAPQPVQQQRTTQQPAPRRVQGQPPQPKPSVLSEDTQNLLRQAVAERIRMKGRQTTTPKKSELAQMFALDMRIMTPKGRQAFYDELGLNRTMRSGIEDVCRTTNNDPTEIGRWLAEAAVSSGWRKAIGYKTTFRELEQQESIDVPKQQKGQPVSGTQNAKTAGQPKPKPKNTSNVL